MNFNYDENLSQNSFYKSLQAQHDILLATAALENWVICVPRAGYFEKGFVFGNDFVLRHILVENKELPGSHFTNLLGQLVILDQKRLYVSTRRNGNEIIAVLFEEIVYKNMNSSGMHKFKLWCLDKPITSGFSEEDEADLAGFLVVPNGSTTSTKQPVTSYYRIACLADAEKFLETEIVKSEFVLNRIQRMCQELENTTKPITTVNILTSSTKLLLNRVLQLVLNSTVYLKKVCKADPNYLRMLKMSVEIYALHHLYHFVMDKIAVIEAADCEASNRQLINLHLRQVEMAPDEQKPLIVEVSDKLLQLHRLTSFYEKIDLLKGILQSISRSGEEPSSDDILSHLVSALIHGKSMYWHSNLVFLKRFQFTEIDDGSSEICYLVTTLEAALQYIHQQPLYNSPTNGQTQEVEAECSAIPPLNEHASVLERIFDEIRHRNEETVTELIRKLSDDKVKSSLGLCHPLCDCPTCRQRIQVNNPTINTQAPSSGNSCLHLLAKYGLVNVIRSLFRDESQLEFGLKNRLGETALHLAAKYGQQNMVLLILHQSGEHGEQLLNETDNQGNIPLHLAAKMGHLSCVKAILYFAEHKQIALKIDAKTYAGNTCLHLATQTGFVSIVETLLEFNASKSIRNNQGYSAFEVSFSSRLRDLIRDENWERISLHQTVRMMSRLEPEQVDQVLKACALGDTDLVLHYLKCGGGGNENACEADDDAELPDRINSANRDGVRPIHAALKYNNVALVKLFLKHNADVDVRTRTRLETPFHWAATGQQVDAVKYLFETVPNLDAILNRRDTDGNTCLHLAILNGNLAFVDLLLKFELDFGAKNKAQKDAITLARRFFYTDIANHMEYMRAQGTSSPDTSGSGQHEQ